MIGPDRITPSKKSTDRGTSALRSLFDADPKLKARLVGIYGVLTVMNLGAWSWAVAAFHRQPALLGVALMVYGLGLRHAVDADHIAAIDNVTRKLMQGGDRPVGVGFFFALGHSAVITLVAAAVALATGALDRINGLREAGGLVSTTVSAAFLLAIAAVNVAIFAGIWRAWHRVRAGHPYIEADLDGLLNGRGLAARLFRPLFRLIGASWQMLLLGFLFGVGFDTASEITMFGISATQMARGLPLLTMLVFPTLFAAGMSLVDTTDGVMMLGAYQWAFVRPLRKLYYNMIITGVSVVVALFVGGLEALGLIGGLVRAHGGAWRWIDFLNGDLNAIGLAIILLFTLAWGVSFLVWRVRRLDQLEQAASL